MTPRSTPFLSLLLIGSLLASACGGTDVEEDPPDSGVNIQTDAGGPGDAGVILQTDAGSPDAGNPDAGSPDAGPVERPSEALFAGTSLPRLALTLPQASIDSLNANRDTYVTGDLRVELNGKVTELQRIGVRLKGRYGSSRDLDEKAAFLLKFDKFQNKQTLFGLKKLALNNMVQDQSMIHERLGYALFRGMNVPAPRSAHAVVYLNDMLYGVYATVEATDDSEFLKHWFGSDDGNLYEGEYGSDLNVGSERSFDQDKGEDVGFSDLTQLAQALDRMNTPATFLEDAARVIDIDTYVRFAATELFLGHWDGYAAYKNNFYIYRRPSDQRWVFIPWGIDQTFVQDVDPWVATGRIQRMCAASMPCRLKLVRAYEQTMERSLLLGLHEEGLRLGSLLWPAVYMDPRREMSVGDVYRGMSDTLDYLDRRPAEIQSQLECADPAKCLRCTQQPAPNGGKLSFCTRKLSVSDAEASCVSQGGHLVSIHDQNTQNAVYAGARAKSGERWWLGLTDRAVEGTFTWLDGSPTNYTAWAGGEPNNVGNEDCTELLGWSGEWNDASCDNQNYYVCALR